MKILDVCSNPLITSECWTYYKFAVMQTSDYFDVWLTNHMDLYIDQNGSAVFGESGMMYPLTYYEDILELKETNLLKIPSSQVVRFLIEQINKGNYIIIDSNYKRLLFPNTNEFQLHEVLVYGYDMKEDELVLSILKQGVFRECRVSFKTFEQSYRECYEYYKSDINRLFNRRLWFFGITLINLKNTYENSNKYYDLIRKINIYKEGRTFIKNNGRSENLAEGYVYYTGSICIEYMAQKIRHSMQDGSINNNAIIDRYQKTCLKILENQRMILYSVKWAFDDLKLCDNRYHKMIEDYDLCCNKIASAVLLFYKFYALKDYSIIHRIKKHLMDSFELEKKILPDILESIKSSYIDREWKKYIDDV